MGIALEEAKRQFGGYEERLCFIGHSHLPIVLEEGEDTRTLLRLTALRRLPALDLDEPRVARTIDAMAARGVAIDPTLAIHEALLRSRNGQVAPGVVDYIDHYNTHRPHGALNQQPPIAPDEAPSKRPPPRSR